MYFGIFADKYIPWLATSMEYTSKDFTSLEIKLNPQAKWSDGVPVTAKDVVFTFEGQMKNEKLPYHASFDQFVDTVTAVDDQTVDVKFKIPAPRFKFEVLTEKFDTGIPIVPEHALSKQKDVNAYAGGTEIPHSGPYDLVAWNANQKIFNLRPDWWAVKAGLIAAARGQAHRHGQPRRPDRPEHGHGRPAAGEQRDGRLARHAQRRDRQHSRAEPEDHDATPATSRPSAISTGGRTRCG